MPRTKTHKELRELAEKSTSVVAWYPHGWEDGTVRGPFHRWFKCDGGQDYPQNVASVSDDVEFCAAAMNNLVPLLDHIDSLEEKIADLKLELILMGRDPDALK